MTKIYYGKQGWRNQDFDVIAADHWLRLVKINDPDVEVVLTKVALGDYQKITPRIDSFIKYLLTSKHG